MVRSITEPGGLHEYQSLSVANAVVGAMESGSAALGLIGAAYAGVAGIATKHGVKQVDRLLSNSKIRLDALVSGWIPYVVGEEKGLVVALDWTDFDDDDHTTLYAAAITTSGRAFPLAWQTVRKSALAGRRNAVEEELLRLVHAALPPDVRVTLLADRGFGRVELYEILALLGWDYVIRFRQNIVVEVDGERAPAQSFVPKNGRPLVRDHVEVTRQGAVVPRVVLVKRAKMKEAWCLATSLTDQSAAEVIQLYGRRFTIEEMLRDTKDLRFGAGLRAVHVRDPARRDRLLFVIAVAHALLTLLGAASERTGMDRLLKANTVKRRTHSLVRQGCMWFKALPNLPDERRVPLLRAFEEILAESSGLASVLLLAGPNLAAL
jgi:hypothetical protein